MIDQNHYFCFQSCFSHVNQCTDQSDGLRASEGVKVSAYDAQYIIVKHGDHGRGGWEARQYCGHGESYVSLRTSVDAALAGCGGAAAVSVRSEVAS